MFQVSKLAELAALGWAAASSLWSTVALGSPPEGRPLTATKNAVAALDHKAISPDRGVVRRRWVDPMRPLVVGRAGPEIGMRDFRYGQAETAGLRSYSNHGLIMASAGLEVYPFALSKMSVVRDIGLIGMFGTSFASTSTTAAGGSSIDDKWSRYEVGARGRFRVTEPPGAVWLGIQATYGDSQFTFSGVDPLATEAPSVEYKYARGGADVRVPFGRFALLGAAGYRYVFSTGALGAKFPRATSNGGDLSIGGAYRFNMNFEARASAEYAAVFTQPNASSGDAFVAGQVLDQYAVFYLGITGFVF